ncbi:unnamed protein product [Phytophthora fragariaefolia]|uniref:Unnamed protein product n=1 Tax=Phytophthora fragariaefolia TaxID=1490495 RepID=A0A9W6TS33_9STRA|nr:unnamed protein product [Phytophthora fragariaefolia]
MLVQFARAYTDNGEMIAWSKIARRMQLWHRAPSDLKTRLNSLKRTYGRNLAAFPPSFLAPVRLSPGRRGSLLHRIRNPSSHHYERANNAVAAPVIQAMVDAAEAPGEQADKQQEVETTEHFAMLLDSGPRLREPLSAFESAQMVQAMFERVERPIVIYSAACPALNAGEILPDGISALITAVTNITTMCFWMLALGSATS